MNPCYVDLCYKYHTSSSADPGSFVRGGSYFDNVFVLFDEGREYKRALNDPPAKRHLNRVSLAGRRWPNIRYWLGSFVMIFRGSGPVLQRNPIVLGFFR